MKKSKDLLEGRTKEWNINDYQGRSKAQVNSNEQVASAAVFLFTVTFVVFVIFNALMNG